MYYNLRGWGLNGLWDFLHESSFFSSISLNNQKRNQHGHIGQHTNALVVHPMLSVFISLLTYSLCAQSLELRTIIFLLYFRACF